MNPLNKKFYPGDVLSAHELNDISEKIDEIVNVINSGEGSVVTWTQIENEGMQIATITINGQDYEVISPINRGPKGDNGKDTDDGEDGKSLEFRWGEGDDANKLGVRYAGTNDPFVYGPILKGNSGKTTEDGKDGKSLEAQWGQGNDASKLGIRYAGTEDDFVYGPDLKGKDGTSAGGGEDGKSLEFRWGEGDDATKLGVRHINAGEDFVYMDLKGKKGEDGGIGNPGKSLTVEWGTGEHENQLIVKKEGDVNFQYSPNLKGKKGEDGGTGNPGKSIEAQWGTGDNANKIGIRYAGTEDDFVYGPNLKGEDGEDISGAIDGRSLEAQWGTGDNANKIGIRYTDTDDPFVYGPVLKGKKGEDSSKGNPGKNLTVEWGTGDNANKLIVKKEGSTDVQYSPDLKGEKGEDGGTGNPGKSLEAQWGTGDNVNKIGIRYAGTEDDFVFGPNLKGEDGEDISGAIDGRSLEAQWGTGDDANKIGIRYVDSGDPFVYGPVLKGKKGQSSDNGNPGKSLTVEWGTGDNANKLIVKKEGSTDVQYSPDLKGEKGEDGGTGNPGKSLEFEWGTGDDANRLGVKQTSGSFQYMNLKGNPGANTQDGQNGKDMEFTWETDQAQDTIKLGTKLHGDSNYTYSVNLKGDKGDDGDKGVTICKLFQSEYDYLVQSRSIDENTLYLIGCAIPPNNELWYFSTEPITIRDYTWGNNVAHVYDNNTHKGIVRNWNNTTEIPNSAFSSNNRISQIILSKNIKTIGKQICWQCTGLSYFIMQNGVTSIGNEAFYYCVSLKTLNIPNSVISIGNSICSRDTNLTSVTIGNNVTSIGEGAFWGCDKLVSINIPNSVTSIGDDAFYGCSSLPYPLYNNHVFAFLPHSYSGTYVVPSYIETIAGGAFACCESLTGIEIPASTINIGTAITRQCSNLTTITVDSNNTIYTSRDNNENECNAVIEIATNKLIAGCKNTIIPNGVIIIGQLAFNYCTFTSINIPDSITTIETHAFGSCYNMRCVIIGSGVTNIADYAFQQLGYGKKAAVVCKTTTPPTLGSKDPFSGVTKSNITLYVPDDYIQDYQGWGGFTNIVPLSTKTIYIDNTTPDALRIAVNNANNEAEIIMSAGTYIESNADYIKFNGKHIIVRAAEGAEVIIQSQTPITVTGVGTVHFVGIKFDASHLNDIGAYEHLIYSTDTNMNVVGGGERNKIILEDCEFYGFNINSSMIYCAPGCQLSSININNCYFHDITKSIVFIDDKPYNRDSYKTDVIINNSTFANISTYSSGYYAGVIDNRSKYGSLKVDHCTFYNVQAINTDYAAIGKVSSTNSIVSNSIFAMPTSTDNLRAIRDVASAINCLTYNYGEDSNTGIHSDVVKINCTIGDPLFVDTINNDFTLGTNSPALTLGDNNTPIGDPRWVHSEN